MNKLSSESTQFGQFFYSQLSCLCLFIIMSTESAAIQDYRTPSQINETSKKVNVDVLKQKLLVEKKKEKLKEQLFYLQL